MIDFSLFQWKKAVERRKDYTIKLLSNQQQFDSRRRIVNNFFILSQEPAPQPQQHMHVNFYAKETNKNFKKVSRLSRLWYNVLYVVLFIIYVSVVQILLFSLT